MKRERIFCGLDIGSQRIKASLIKARGVDEIDILGISEVPTRGFQNSSVTDLSELSESIYQAIQGLTQKTSVKLKEVQLGAGRDLVETRISRTVIPLVDRGTKVITQSDVKNVNHQACLLGVKMDEDLLHNFSQYYCVDDVNTAMNPVGLYGRKLEVNLFLVIAHAIRMKNIIKAVNQAGYEVANIFFTSFVSSEASLKNAVKREGCALVDIGSSMADVLIFKDGYLRYRNMTNLGGDHITQTISDRLTLSFGLAEDIKKSYAIALNTEVKKEEILVKKETGYIPIKREVVCRAIEPEVTKVVEFIQEAIRASQMSAQLNAGIVMLGGGSLLPGLIERIEGATNFSVRLGRIQNSNKINNTAIFAACIGLAQGGVKKIWGNSFSVEGPVNWLRSFSNKVSELYQEYF